MIPRPALTQWRQQAPWQTDLQVEQDLLLSILAIRVAHHHYLGDRLAWRGGTCLHKLHLAAPWRYSEDLDYVLVDENPDHGRVADALRGVVADMGMGVHHSEVTPTRVNVYADTEATVGGDRIRVKFEVNCADARPVLDPVHLPHSVTTRWRTQRADVLTFQAPELIGTKIRALAQRRKGRDLSDMWLARRELVIDDTDLAVAGHHYLNHEGIEPAHLRQQLAAHTTDRDFTHDLDLLTTDPYDGFDVVEQTHQLIRWSDLHLDPLFDERRSASARARRDALRRRSGAAAGDLQCTIHIVQDGGLSRCGEFHAPQGACRQHPPGTPAVME